MAAIPVSPENFRAAAHCLIEIFANTKKSRYLIYGRVRPSRQRAPPSARDLFAAINHSSLCRFF